MQTVTDLTTRRTIGRYGQTPNLIGIHTMETPERSNAAENVAKYFKRVNASSHWCVDDNSRVRVVEDKDMAWTLPGANPRSLNIELAGYAGQTAGEWSDAYSAALLENAAQCAAEWCVKYGIPVRRLSDAQIRAGVKGFAGHVDVNRVYRKSSHWDPGPNFPWDHFLGRVQALLGGEPPAPPGPIQDNRPRNADGSLRIDQDGIEGPQTIARWQEVMGTHIDGVISRPKSNLIVADQLFLNSVLNPGDVQNLTGKPRLDPDGIRGKKTDIARQYWLHHVVGAQHQRNLIGQLLDVDGIWGPQSTEVFQFALNQATRGSKRYGQVA